MSVYKYLFPAVCFFAVLVTACRKDQNNIDYKELNKVSIETQDSSFVITQYDSLKIETTLHESMSEGAAYSYEWKLYPMIGGQTEESVILSNEKNLAAPVNASPGQYYLQYTVTDTKTGVASFMQYSVEVNGKFYEGWLVASNKDGKAMLSFVRTDDTVFLTPAEIVNNKTYPGNALAIHTAIAYNISLMLFFTSEGVYRFGPDDFLENGTTTDLFPNGKQFGANPAYALGKLEADQYIVDQGGLYAGLGPSFFPSDVLSPYSDRFSGDYSLFPAVMASSYLSTFFYDNKYKRFMQVSFAGREINVGANTGGAFNMANVGKTMIACDYGRTSLFANQYYMVMKDETNYYLYSLNDGMPENVQVIGNSPDLENARAFATSGVVQHMYYAAGNKIYLYDMLADNARLVYEFPSGYEVSDLEMLRSTSGTLVVAANENGNGEVYYFDLDNLGNFAGDTYTKKFTGFGSIVQLSYRNR